MPPDLAGAATYALSRLARELQPELCYHSIAHTRDDVVVMATRLAALAKLSHDGLVLLQTAAYFHDLGYIVRRTEHEEAGVAIAAAVLPSFGYSPGQIERIGAMIRATRVPQQPASLPEQILADADLDVLGREDFLGHNRVLRQELANYGEHFSDEDWYARQLAFLQGHSYWTPAARALRDEMKQRNQELVAGLLAAAREAGL